MEQREKLKLCIKKETGFRFEIDLIPTDLFEISIENEYGAEGIWYVTLDTLPHMLRDLKRAGNDYSLWK